MKIVIKVLIFLILLITFNLSAHQRSESYSKWIIDEQEENFSLNIVFTIRLSNLNRIEAPLEKGWESRISKHVISSIKPTSDCMAEGSPRIVISPQSDLLKISWFLSCFNNISEIRNDAFFEKDQTHSHIARIIYDGNLSLEKLFTNQVRSWKLDKNLTSNQGFKSSSFKDYVSLGIKHISTGYDHLAFIFGLLLLNQRPKKLFLAVTGFTLGHSLTLALAVLNYVKPVNTFIEALIGFSIALVGFEFLLRKTNQKSLYIKYLFFSLLLFITLYSLLTNGRYFLGLLGLFLFTICYLVLASKNFSNYFSLFIASAFGLIHGFGFGGFLFDIGFPDERLIPALFGFNIGVEIGQLFALSVFILLSFLIYRFKVNNKEIIAPILASLLVALGTSWFIDRII